MICRAVKVKDSLYLFKFFKFFQSKVNEYDKICEDALEESKKISELNFREWLDSPWKGFFEDRYGKVELKMKKDTGVDEEILTRIGNVSSFGCAHFKCKNSHKKNLIFCAFL